MACSHRKAKSLTRLHVIILHGAQRGIWRFHQCRVVERVLSSEHVGTQLVRPRCIHIEEL
jgi:hypothetical protein